jgi:hypothetical protein
MASDNFLSRNTVVIFFYITILVAGVGLYITLKKSLNVSRYNSGASVSEVVILNDLLLKTAREFQSAEPAEQQRMLMGIVAMAQNRLARFEEIAQVQPRDIMDHVLTSEERAVIPQAVQKYIEHPISVSGVIRRVLVRPGARPQYLLTTSGKRESNLYVVGVLPEEFLDRSVTFDAVDLGSSLITDFFLHTP